MRHLGEYADGMNGENITHHRGCRFLGTVATHARGKMLEREREGTISKKRGHHALRATRHFGKSPQPHKGVHAQFCFSGNSRTCTVLWSDITPLQRKTGTSHTIQKYLFFQFLVFIEERRGKQRKRFLWFPKLRSINFPSSKFELEQTILHNLH